MKIVLTGGPCAGKTTIAEILVKTFDRTLVMIPEAASILFTGGFPRLPSPEGQRCQQRAIYHVQSELENIYRNENPGVSLICDRGGLDGLAYWPGEADEFFTSLATDMQKEVARYDWVIHLDTTGTKEYRRSPVRVEPFELANHVNEKVKAAWQAHPRRIIIPHNEDFSRKIIVTLEVVTRILEGRAYEDVLAATRMNS